MKNNAYVFVNGTPVPLGSLTLIGRNLREIDNLTKAAMKEAGFTHYLYLLKDGDKK